MERHCYVAGGTGRERRGVVAAGRRLGPCRWCKNSVSPGEVCCEQWGCSWLPSAAVGPVCQERGMNEGRRVPVTVPVQMTASACSER